MAKSVPCPECNRVLKSQNPIPPGQRLRCPGCETTFVMPRGEASPIQAGKRTSLQGQQAKPTTLRGRDDYDDNDDAPAPPRRRSRRDEDEFSERPQKKRRYDDDDDRPRSKSRRRDDDDGDDRPLKKKRRKSGGAPWILISSGVAAFVVVFLLTAFVWPGFLRSGGSSLSGPDLLALAPADADCVLGINMVPARRDPETVKQMEQGLALLQLQGMPPEIRDLIKDADRAMASFKIAQQPHMVAAVMTSKSYDNETLKKLLQVDKADNVQGRTIFKKQMGGNDPHPLMGHLVDPKILVFGIMPEAEFVKALNNFGKNPVITGDLLSRARQLEPTVLWGVVLNRGLVSEQLRKIPPPPMGAELLAIAQRAKMGSFSFDYLPNKDTKVAVSLDCANGNDATTVKTTIDNLWAFGLAMADGQAPAEAKGLMNDLKNSFKVATAGTEVTASVQISEKTTRELQALNQGMIGGAPKVRGKAGKGLR